MSTIAAGEWRRLIVVYEAARARCEAAADAADELAFDDPAYEAAEARHEALRRAFQEREDELLDVAAPDLDGVAYQLRVFAERFHLAVLDEPEMAGEDRPAGAFLRRILEGLRAQAGPGGQLRA